MSDGFRPRTQHERSLRDVRPNVRRLSHDALLDDENSRFYRSSYGQGRLLERYNIYNRPQNEGTGEYRLYNSRHQRQRTSVHGQDVQEIEFRLATTFSPSPSTLSSRYERPVWPDEMFGRNDKFVNDVWKDSETRWHSRFKGTERTNNLWDNVRYLDKNNEERESFEEYRPSVRIEERRRPAGWRRV